MTTFTVMIIWIFVALSIGLLGASLRIWLEFTQRARQLHGETEHARSLIENHRATLAAVQAKTDDVKAEGETLLKERADLETKVQESRAQLTTLEERLERSRPARFRVEKDDQGDDLF